MQDPSKATGLLPMQTLAIALGSLLANHTGIVLAFFVYIYFVPNINMEQKYIFLSKHKRRPKVTANFQPITYIILWSLASHISQLFYPYPRLLVSHVQPLLPTQIHLSKHTGSYLVMIDTPA